MSPIQYRAHYDQNYLQIRLNFWVKCKLGLFHFKKKINL
jgi:hypothetical protein